MNHDTIYLILSFCSDINRQILSSVSKSFNRLSPKNKLKKEEFFDVLIRTNNVEQIKLIPVDHVRDEKYLKLAIEYNYSEIVFYLLDLVKNKKSWFLVLAIIKGNLDIIRYLNDNNFPKHRMAVLFACQTGRLDIVKYLIENGFKTHRYSNQIALKTNNCELVEYLSLILKHDRELKILV